MVNDGYKYRLGKTLVMSILSEFFDIREWGTSYPIVWWLYFQKISDDLIYDCFLSSEEKFQ